jgi:ribosome modulation factor
MATQLLSLNRTETPKRRRRDNDPWIEGYDARLALLARSANPYRGADWRRLWDNGWMEAQADQSDKSAPAAGK